jgi:hypothetical protein
MRLSLTRSESIDLTIIITHLTLLHLYMKLMVRLGGYIVNLCDFCSYRIIGKLTSFLQLQEFRLQKPTVDSPTSVTRLSLTVQKQSWVGSR